MAQFHGNNRSEAQYGSIAGPSCCLQLFNMIVTCIQQLE